MLQPSSLCYAVPSLKRRFMKHGFAVWSTLCQRITSTLIFSVSHNIGTKWRCFIAEWNEAASYLRKQMLHLKRRFMKHAWRRMKRHCVPWSAPSVHEAKPFQASCFLPWNQGKKMVGIERFELSTFWPPVKRAKPSCAISRLHSFIYCNFCILQVYLSGFLQKNQKFILKNVPGGNLTTAGKISCVKFTYQKQFGINPIAAFYCRQ